MSSVPVPKILVAESDPQLRLRSETLLRAANYQVASVSEASSALDTAREFHPDVVLLDMALPQCNAIELCRLLKSDATLLGTVVIHVFKQPSSIPAILRGPDCGDGQLVRPITDESLLLSVRSMLRVKQAEDRLRQFEQRGREEFDRRSAERDLELLAEYSASAPDSSVTAGLYAGGPLSASAPATFTELCLQYSNLFELRIEQATFKVERNLTGHLRKLAGRLGLLRASPRDVVELHTRAIRHKLAGDNMHKRRHYTDEGRFMLLELMGYLADYYRDRSLGSLAAGGDV